MYLFLFKGAIPITRILSYKEFCKGRKRTIKEFLIHFLENYPQGLCCRDIAQISGIYVQSLTNPLLHLVKDGILEIKGNYRHDSTNRMVQYYGLPGKGQNEEQ